MLLNLDAASIAQPGRRCPPPSEVDPGRQAMYAPNFEPRDPRLRRLMDVATELEVLGLASDRLAARELPFMLTGSFALAYYSTPRMTRDLDIVLAVAEKDVEQLVADFTPDFYIDADAVRTAIRTERMFTVMHLESGIKVDLIVRKSAEYRQLELARRQRVELGGVRTWIVSREDLILLP